MKLEDIYKTIEKHREELPINVHALASDLGIHVESTHLKDDISGYIGREKDDKYNIVVNSGHPETRQRFTISHEIGHFLYDKDVLENERICDDKLFRGGSCSNLPQEKEIRASRFAAALLMPENKILEEASKLGQTVSAMANTFGTSRAAMGIRLNGLKIIL